MNDLKTILIGAVMAPLALVLGVLPMVVSITVGYALYKLFLG